MIFKWDDLQILNDPAELIRKRPQMFVREVSGPELTERLAGDVLRLTGGPVTMQKVSSWWVIAGERDWMTLRPNLSVEDLFTRMIPFPEAGQNSIRGEVVLAAFAEAVFTVSKVGALVIKGKVPNNDPIWRFVKARSEWQRVVAFRLADKEKN